MVDYHETQSIPEMLGFAFANEEERRIDRERTEPYSELSYRARYLLYEDEAQDLLRRFDNHPDISRHLHIRYAQDTEYRERIDGGYPEMDRKMRAAGVIPQEEMDLVDRLNRDTPDE